MTTKEDLNREKRDQFSIFLSETLRELRSYYDFTNTHPNERLAMNKAINHLWDLESLVKNQPPNTDEFVVYEVCAECAIKMLPLGKTEVVYCPNCGKDNRSEI